MRRTILALATAGAAAAATLTGTSAHAGEPNPVIEAPGPVAFASPTGNLGCTMDAEKGVTCNADERQWETPPRDCEPGTSAGVLRLAQVGAGGCATQAGQALAHEGTAPTAWWSGHPNAGHRIDWHGAPTVALNYGQTIKVAEFQCSSAEAGITCLNQETGGRLEIAKEAYRLG
ncbi:hypothetical protein [Mariniluteicoccus flavus]